ncbi:MAG: FRG domain-containing protein [Spirochaetaceae bacterium]|nr:FRG domain-containing protein [Spirochaetaceae bacterium]
MENKIYLETYEISSAEEAINLNALYGKYSNLNESYVFRGQKDINYSLIPSSLRIGNKEYLWSLSGGKPIVENQSEWENWQIIAEYNILKNFYNIADRSGLELPRVDRFRNNIDDNFELSTYLNTEEWLPKDFMEIAGLAQHYGLPTRLLDWTYDYKIALSFATSGIYNIDEVKKDCVVWAINHQYFNFLKPAYNKSPLQFYRPSYHGNKYLGAQKGLFSTWKITKRGLADLPNLHPALNQEVINRSPLDKLICDFIDNNIKESEEYFQNNKLLYKYIIPKDLKLDILKQLKRDKYSEEYLFPGFQGVCLSMENNLKMCDFG